MKTFPIVYIEFRGFEILFYLGFGGMGVMKNEWKSLLFSSFLFHCVCATKRFKTHPITCFYLLFYALISLLAALAV